nr:uncharacterized protein LOC127330820 [Lolium perenne]
MASSSSSVVPAAGGHQEDIAPLPLIRCPRCNRGTTIWFISSTEKNPGRHFYKCEYHGTPVCNFWKWEDKYVEYIIARWGHVFSPAPLQAGTDELKAMLLQNKADIKNIKWMLMGWITVVALLLAAKY